MPEGRTYLIIFINSLYMLKRFIALFMPGLLLLGGCSKSPSTVLPTNLYAPEDYPNTINALNSVLATGYSAMRDANLYGFNYLPKAMANATHVAQDGGFDAGWTEMEGMARAIEARARTPIRNVRGRRIAECG